MMFEVTAPSKTFLVGEYIALNGGPALLLNTNPLFRLNIHVQTPGGTQGIKAVSPAGRWIAQHAEIFDGLQLQFQDPYSGKGGFGCSSAQFIMAYAIKSKSNITVPPLTPDALKTLQQAYLSVAWDGEGQAPSGVDLVAQLCGDICFYHQREKQLEKINWPFSHMDYCLLHTGVKLATHQHLRNLPVLASADLETLAVAAYHSCKNHDAFAFIDAINNYARTLQQMGLVAQHTQTLLDIVNQQAGVLASKGCGALGADVVLILLDSEYRQSFKRWLAEQHLQHALLSQETAPGLTITPRENP